MADQQRRLRLHGLTETFTLEQMQSIFDTNVFGVQRTIRAALPQMLNKRAVCSFR